MTSFAYWNNWPKPYRILFIMLLVLLAGSILYFVIANFSEAGFAIDWVLTPAFEAVEVPLQAWQHPLSNVEVPLSTYIVKQTFWGSTLQLNTTAATLSLFFFFAALAVALATITTLKKLWFYIGMAAFCAVVVLLRLEQLGIAGQFNNTPAGVIFLLFLPLAYYFHSIRPQTSYAARLLTFTVLIALLSVAGGVLATVPYPLLYVLNYGMPAIMALSFLLMVLVGPEIIVGILYLITASATSGSRGSFRHFSLASGLYLLNLILYYLQERQYLDWDIYLLSPYWILIISLFVGLWTLRLRRETMGHVVLIEPYGFFLYLALGALTFSIMAYAAATANDPLLETYEDAILYTHIGMGAALGLYIVANFYALLKQNQKVYKVIYQPKLMPLFTARLAGLLIIFGLYAARGNYPLFQAMAAYYNGIGDVYAIQDDLVVSQHYYRLGSQYHIRNHRSNYALASLALNANQPKTAAVFLKEAIQRQATPYAYATLAKLYQEQGQFFDALFTLQQGIRQFPSSGPLYNNLGLYYGVTGATDSAFYFLQAASADDKSKEAAMANMLGVLAQSKANISPDSLLNWDTQLHLPLQNNLLAMANRQGYRLKNLPPPLQVLKSDSSITAPLYLLNYALQTQTPDTALIRHTRSGYEKAQLSMLEEQWGLAFALQLYELPNYYEAFAAMQDLAYRSQFNNITYYKILGKWALEQGAPRLAAEWFEQAYSRGDLIAGFYKAIALAESAQPAAAAASLLSLPDSLLSTALQQRKTLALAALSDTPIDNFPEPEELALLRLSLRPQTLIPAERNALLATLSTAKNKASALLRLSENALRTGQPAEAQPYLSQLQEQYQTLSAQDRISLQRLRFDYPNQTAVLAVPESAPILLRLQQEAAQQLSKGNVAKSLALLMRVAAASPFEEGALLQAVQLLNTLDQEEEAYSLIRRGLFLNKYSVPLLEAYALQSLRMGLDTYAEETLIELQKLAPEERYKKYFSEYQQLKNSLTNKASW